MPKSILLLQETYLPMRGGAEWHVYYLARTLLERGHRVEIVTGDPQLPLMEPDICPVRRYQHARGLRALPFLPFWFIRLALMFRRFDIVHVHYSSFLAFVLVLAGRLVGKPVVMTLHGLGTLDSSVGRSIWRRLFRYTSMKLAHRIVATSEEMRSVAEHFAAVRSVVDTGRHSDLSVFQSIRATLDGYSIFMPA